MFSIQSDKLDNEQIFCSVVMPVHNGEKFLREAIESVLNQTYTNFEFLIIENCSTDTSLDIIKSYKDERIKLIIEKDCGIVKAYNRGFKDAKGEIIVIHDQDDFSNHNRIEKQLTYLTMNKLDVCGSFFYVINEKNKIIESKKSPITDIYSKIELFYYKMAIFNPTVMLRKEIFSKYDYFNEKYIYDFDYEFYLRIKEKIKLGNIPELLYYWRYWRNSWSFKVRKNSEISSFKLSMNALEKSRDKYINEYYLIKGLIFYYNNKLFQALVNLSKRRCSTKHYEQIRRRYIIIIIGGNFITKVVRQYALYNLTFFLLVKKIINYFFPRYNNS